MASPSEQARGATEEEKPLPQLPLEILLNIIQRGDAVTVVRCAATQKLLRGAILAPAFRARLGVDPAGLLLGFSFLEDGVARAVDTPPLATGGGRRGQPLVRLHDAVVRGRNRFKLVAWRDELLVVLRDHRNDRSHTALYNLGVFNVLTGDVLHFLPPISLPPVRMPIPNQIFWSGGFYTFVLLSAGPNFELLAAGSGLRTRIFASDQAEWVPLRDTTFLGQHHTTTYRNYHATCSRPAVVGRTVYWFCSPRTPSPLCPPSNLQPRILALDVDAAEATTRKVPTYCFSDVQWPYFDGRVLLASLRGNLCLFVLDSHGISAWTPSSASETTTMWTRQVMVTRPEFEARVVLDHPHGFDALYLQAYGERTRTIILQLTTTTTRMFLLRLHIGQGSDLVRAVTLGSNESRHYGITLSLHETHLASLLEDMKSFPLQAPEATSD